MSETSAAKGRVTVFTLEERHLKKFEEWRKTHDPGCRHLRPRGSGAIGGSFTFSFSPSSIGTFIMVKCMCGASVDLTEDEDW